MLPNFLVPEQVVRQNGSGAVVDLGDSAGNVLSVTLGIYRILEQESMDLTIWGSTDGAEWGSKPLISFPQKFYCGAYNLTLDLSDHPEIHYLRTEWKLGRWGRGEPTPLFGFYVFAETASESVMRAAS